MTAVSRILLGLVFLLTFSFVVMTPEVSHAATNLFGEIDCTGAAANSAACNSQTTSNPLSGNGGLINRITRIVAYVGGVIAVIIIIISGINYMTANGDSSKITSARRSLTYAIIGLLVIALAQTIINFVLSRI